MLVHDFQDCTVKTVTLIAWYGSESVEVDISAELWAGMLAGGQDELRDRPKIHVHDDDDHDQD